MKTPIKIASACAALALMATPALAAPRNCAPPVTTTCQTTYGTVHHSPVIPSTYTHTYRHAAPVAHAGRVTREVRYVDRHYTRGDYHGDRHYTTRHAPRTCGTPVYTKRHTTHYYEKPRYTKRHHGHYTHGHYSHGYNHGRSNISFGISIGSGHGYHAGHYNRGHSYRHSGYRHTPRYHVGSRSRHYGHNYRGSRYRCR